MGNQSKSNKKVVIVLSKMEYPEAPGIPVLPGPVYALSESDPNPNPNPKKKIFKKCITVGPSAYHKKFYRNNSRIG